MISNHTNKDKYLKYKEKYNKLKKNNLNIQKAGNDWSTYLSFVAAAGITASIYGYQKWKKHRDNVNNEAELNRIDGLIFNEERINKNETEIDNISIKIDDYEFYLIGFLDTKDKRGMLLIKSINLINNNKKYFQAYKSISEMGFWRLCMIHEGNYYKGTKAWWSDNSDYIQGTFIHLTLQNFINENISKCKKIKYNISCFESQYLKDSIDNNRIYDIEPFKTYAKNKENLHHLVKRAPKQLFGWNVNQRLVDLSQKLKNTPGFDKFIINEKNKYEFNTTSIGEHQKLELKANIIEYQFENNISLFAYRYDLNVIYKSLPDNPKFTYDKKGVCPLTMIPTNTKITEFGLYTNFVRCGNYIGKLFDYSNQLPGDLSYDYEQFGDSVNQCYLFIGSNYDNVYPYY